MILELAGWIYEHRMELTFNTILLFILRKFILTELKRILRFNRTDAVLHNLKIIMEEMGKGDQWRSNLPMNGFAFTLVPFSKKLSLFSFKDMKHQTRRKNMNRLKSKKLWLAIAGALIPVINNEFSINLNLDTMIGMWSILGVGIAAIAHVDAKQAAATVTAVKVAVTADPNATYKDMVKTVNVVHTAITSILADLKKDDGSQAFRDAANAYTQLHSIVNDFRKPDPLPEIPTLAETKVS